MSRNFRSVKLDGGGYLVSLALAALLAFFTSIVTAEERQVGPGKTYETLEALRTSGDLLSGDTIVHGDDSSLTQPLTTSATNLTFKGSGTISPNGSNSLYRNISQEGDWVTFAADSSAPLVFSGFSTSGDGGVADTPSLNITGGSIIFVGNKAGGLGGAFEVYDNGTFRATDGDFLFQGNKDGVDAVGNGGKANAFYMYNYENRMTLMLAAEAGRSIDFYDPVTSNGAARNLTIDINPEATDTGRVMFDGSDYANDGKENRTSAVYGNTTVGYGEMALKGDAIYGAESYVGSFTLGQEATLTSDAAKNSIQANWITMAGTVDIANGGVLELLSDGLVTFNGLLNIALDMDSFGFLEVFGNLTFGDDAMLSLAWEGATSFTDDWSKDYTLFTASGNLEGNLLLDMSTFGKEFTGVLNNNVLTLSYTASDTDPSSTVPEPATLLMFSLGALGAGLAARRRMKKG